MFTRKDYLDGKATHRQYYAQFVSAAHVARINSSIKITKTTDLNKISLAFWDCVARMPVPAYTVKKLMECGDYATLSGSVCILKEAAEQIKESLLTKNESSV